jgi:predicted DCC family thiol-disulfide oxidoreductase YuxK
MVLVKGENAYIKSEAVIESGKSLGGLWNLGIALYLIPKGIREKSYEWVSKNRLSFFGKKSACDMPSKKLRKKLMD